MSINLHTIQESDLQRVDWLTILLVFLSKGHLAIVLQVKPLNAPPDQVLPARLHGRTQQTGVQRCYFAWMFRRAGVTPGFRCQCDGEEQEQEQPAPVSVLPWRSCLVVKLSYVGMTGLSLTGTLLATQMRHDWKSAHLKKQDCQVMFVEAELSGPMAQVRAV